MNARSFSYNALGELTSATNPESGQTSYTYDADGNLATKTDARNLTITYAYDALNRLTGKTYSDSTPPVTYNYDQTSAHGQTLTNTIGRLSSESTAGTYATAAIFSYDPIGRILNNSQQTPGGSALQAVNYTYDLVGNMLTSSVPGAGTFTNTYNSASRLTGSTTPFTGNQGGVPTTLVSSAHYNTLGKLASQSLGNGLTETWGYDNRERLASYSANNGSSNVYSYSLSYSANGNVMSSNDSVNGDWVYGYDDFNRLTSSSFTSSLVHPAASYSYVYDRFGNRWQQNVTSGSGDMSSLSFDASNHITGSGAAYDAAGNMTYDGTNTYTYDAEGRIATVPSLGTTYVYDAEGRRVAIAKSTSGWCYAYDLEGHVILEYVCFNGAGRVREEYYVSGRHLITYTSWPHFNHQDWLASDRYRTKPTGSQYGYCGNNPFGDNLSCPEANGDLSPVHFTGKERDWSNQPSPTNLDNFGARFYSSSLARFMSPDWAAKPTAVPYASFGNPQSLNLYSYVKNNPVTTRDPDGHCDPGLNCLESNFKAGVAQIENAYAKAGRALAAPVGTIGAGVGEVIAGVESGNGQQITQGLNKIGATATLLGAGALGEAPATVEGSSGLADSALVVRGGVATPTQLTTGAESIAEDGTLNGVSVRSANGATVEQLSQGIQNNKVSVTTVGTVRAAGGNVVETPQAGIPCHCDMNGVTAEKGSQLFKVQPNPSKIRVKEPNQ